MHFRLNTLVWAAYAKFIDDGPDVNILAVLWFSTHTGESALHFAVVSGNLDLVKLLVQIFPTENANDKRRKTEAINQRATGRFFLPDDLKDCKNLNEIQNKKTNYGGRHQIAQI